MKLIVKRERLKINDELTEKADDEITLIPPIFVYEGVELDYIRDAAGVEHYFTKDGYYDGYGGMTAGLESGCEPDANEEGNRINPFPSF